MFKLNNFEFSTEKEYNNAKKEKETIEYLKSKMDLNDIKGVYKLYELCIQKKTFHTIIGYTFLNDLRKILIASKKVTNEQLPSIPIIKTSAYALDTPSEKEAKINKQLLQDYKIKYRNSIIVSLILVIVIIIMFVVMYFSDNTAMGDYETKILNKYSQWQEQLEEKEKKLNEKEQNLMQN